MSDPVRVMILPSPPSSGSIGSVTKSLGIARSLEKRGCSVCFVIGDTLGELVSRNGFKVYPYPSPVPDGRIKKIDNLVDFIAWTGMADAGFVDSAIKAELDAIRDFEPDVVFAEARPSAAVSANAAGVPSVMIASWPCNPMHPANACCMGKYTDVFNERLRRFGLPEIANITELFYMRSTVKLAPTLPELEPEMSDIDGIRFVGYILDLDYDRSQIPGWYGDWLDLPQVFIYLSVGAISPEIYIEVVIETFRDMPYRVICGCGYHYSLKVLPEGLDNIKFVRYVPTAAIMKDTALVIFHGGQDTMLTTLLHGIPSITIPGKHYERDYNATRLSGLGASIKLPVLGFRPNRLRKAIEEVADGEYGIASRKLSEKLKTYGGTEECADILISTALSGKC